MVVKSVYSSRGTSLASEGTIFLDPFSIATVNLTTSYATVKTVTLQKDLQQWITGELVAVLFKFTASATEPSSNVNQIQLTLNGTALDSYTDITITTSGQTYGVIVPIRDTVHNNIFRVQAKTSDVTGTPAISLSTVDLSGRYSVS